jgi:hypothetical protein
LQQRFAGSVEKPARENIKVHVAHHLRRRLLLEGQL